MIRITYILLFTFFTVCVYSQEVTFQKNTNQTARILKHDLSKNKDSLVFKSEELIRQVDIFNDDYSNTTVIDSKSARIEIGNLPVGEFIVQARLGRKRIIMYLIKSELIDADIVTAESSKPTHNDTNILNRKSIHTLEEKPTTYYWVVYENNTYTGSSKTMSMETEADVAKLIERNKLELTTEIAKDNTLIVFEVYDTLKFMRKQYSEPEYFKSSNSALFNVEPYYKSANMTLTDR